MRGLRCLIRHGGHLYDTVFLRTMYRGRRRLLAVRLCFRCGRVRATIPEEHEARRVEREGAVA